MRVGAAGAWAHRCARMARADVAQLAEQSICNRQVTGSIPVVGLRQVASHGLLGEIGYNRITWVDVPSGKGDGL